MVNLAELVPYHGSRQGFVWIHHCFQQPPYRHKMLSQEQTWGLNAAQNGVIIGAYLVLYI